MHPCLKEILKVHIESLLHSEYLYVLYGEGAGPAYFDTIPGKFTFKVFYVNY